MTISTRHFGNRGNNAPHGIEVTVSDWGGNSSIMEDVTNLNGEVAEDFIFSLRQVADELEEQNNKARR
jgi:hypothetical protein